MLAIGQKKAVTLEAVRSVKFVFKQFHLNAVTVRQVEIKRRYVCMDMERGGGHKGSCETF